MFPDSCRIALVLVSIEARILFRAFVRMKKTAVSFLVTFYRGISLIESAWTDTLMMADQTST